jgi:hypothetical protein
MLHFPLNQYKLCWILVVDAPQRGIAIARGTAVAAMGNDSQYCTSKGS